MILASLITLVIGSTILVPMISQRRHHTTTNFLKCNFIMALLILSIVTLCSSIYGIRENWFREQPACAFRAYAFTSMCMVICTSFSIQALSRAFHVILVRHKILRTWGVHIIMVFLTWASSFLFQMVPFYFTSDFYRLELESRCCVATTQHPFLALYSTSTAFFIPMLIIIFTYAMIFWAVRKTKHQIHVIDPIQPQMRTDRVVHRPLNIRRELKIMNQMMLQLGLTILSGSLYVILLMWQLFARYNAPELLYVLSIDAIVFGAMAIMLILLIKNKNMIIEYFQRLIRKFRCCQNCFVTWMTDQTYNEIYFDSFSKTTIIFRESVVLIL